jgi:hypothetical protein
MLSRFDETLAFLARVPYQIKVRSEVTDDLCEVNKYQTASAITFDFSAG